MNRYKVKYELIGRGDSAIITVETKVQAIDMVSALRASKGMLSDKYEYKLLKVERL